MEIILYYRICKHFHKASSGEAQGTSLKEVHLGRALYKVYTSANFLCACRKWTLKKRSIIW